MHTASVFAGCPVWRAHTGNPRLLATSAFESREATQDTDRVSS
jgi:hypothetical protein